MRTEDDASRHDITPRTTLVVPQPSHRDTGDRGVAAVVNGSRHCRVPAILDSRARAIEVAHMNRESYGNHGLRVRAHCTELCVTESVTAYAPAAAYEWPTIE